MCCIDTCLSWEKSRDHDQSGCERKREQSFQEEQWEKEKWSVVFNNAEVRIILLFYPSTLVSARNNDKQLIVMVLFNNGKR